MYDILCRKDHNCYFAKNAVNDSKFKILEHFKIENIDNKMFWHMIYGGLVMAKTSCVVPMSIHNKIVYIK